MRAFVFLGKFAEFYYHKIFEKEADDGLRVCMDKCSPCGISITEDIKFCLCHMIKR